VARINEPSRLEDILHQHIRASCFRGFKRIKKNCGGIRSIFLLNQRNARSFSPDSKLIRGGGAKRISCTDEYIITLSLDTLGQLANSRRFANTIDTYNHHHVRSDVFRDVSFGRYTLVFRPSQDMQQLVLNRLLQGVEIIDLISRHAAANGLKNFQGRGDSDIGSDQYFFKLVQQLFVNLLATTEYCIKSIREGIASCCNRVSARFS